MGDRITDFIGGWVGGAAGILVGSPFDVVKARIQAPNISNTNRSRGSLNVMTHMMKEEGMASLFKGLSASLMGQAGLNGVLFTTYGNILRKIHNQERDKGAQDPTLGQVVLAGGGAGIACFLFSAPSELIKIQAQVSTMDKKSLQVAKKIYLRNGLSGFYQGGWITLAREIPGYGIYFGVYEGIKRVMNVENNDATTRLLFAGGMAGAVSWASIYPIDVIKSRIQMQVLDSRSSRVSGIQDTSRPYTSIKDCVIRSYKAEGIYVFFRGFIPTVLKGFPVGAVSFWVYEIVIELLS